MENSQYSVLLVDDEPAVLKSLQLVLERAGFDVLAVNDGRVAIEAMQSGRFDLVLTDLVMPDREGVETIIELRRTHPNLPIIAMSGGGMGSADLYLSVAAQVGANATLLKPFSEAQLLSAVRPVLGEPM